MISAMWLGDENGDGIVDGSCTYAYTYLKHHPDTRTILVKIVFWVMIRGMELLMLGSTYHTRSYQVCTSGRSCY